MKNNTVPLSQNITEYLSNLYGAEWADDYAHFTLEARGIYIRFNSLRATKDELIESLKSGYDIEVSEVEGFPYALKVEKDENENIGKTIEHITGSYYIQSSSSMLPPLVLNPRPGERVLDMCAAPGSKTTMIAQMMQNSGSLVANEVAQNRAGILSFNMERMIVVNSAILKMPGEQMSSYYPEFFDKILVDAPCSGLGIIQKKGEVNNRWNIDLVKRLAFLQQKLLISAIKMLAPGGTLVYSTCTLTLEENEDMINFLLENYPLDIEDITLPIPAEDGFTSINGIPLNSGVAKARRINPLIAKTEGFFVAKLTKRESINHKPKNYVKYAQPKYPRTKLVTLAVNAMSEQFGVPAEAIDNYSYYEQHSDIFIVSKNWDGGNFTRQSKLGLKIGALDNYGNFIFHTNGAKIFEKHITKNIYECLSADDIKTYLDGGIIRTGTSGHNKGQAVFCYRNRKLGTGVFVESGFKSRFPRAFRTQSITMANAE